jgi:flagellar biosynthesis protein FliQ
MENLLAVFVAVTAAAVVLQAGILVALYVAMTKTTAQLEGEVQELKAKTLPVLDNASLMLTELRPKAEQIAENLIKLHPQILAIVDNLVELKPKMQTVLDNLADTTTTVRSEVHRVDAAVSDAVDRARLQVIRADEMLSRTFDRVAHTSELVTKTVVSPVRQVSGIVRGVTVGVEYLLGNRARKNGDSRGNRRPVQQDEMFI